MSEDKTKKAGLFESFVAKIEADGPLEATVLASALPRQAASPRARRAAQHIVGGVASDPDRVGRLAGLLDELCAADSAAVAPLKRRNAS